MNKNPKKLPSLIANMSTIEEVHNYYQKIINCMPYNVYWLDKNCITQGCNKNVLEFIGLKEIDEFVGITYEQMGELAGWPEHAKLYKKDDEEAMLARQPNLNIEDPPLIDKEGNPTYYLSSRVPLFSDDQKDIIGVVGISVDVTPLREAQAKAELANVAKTEFIANMSHDIRTPLAGIVGISRLLTERVSNEENKQFAHWINECGEQLMHLLDEILISIENPEQQIIQKKPIDLRQCIEDVLTLETPMLKLKNLDFIYHIEENTPRFVITDPTKLNRILLNLISNAVKFTEKGHVGVNISLTSQNANEARILFKIFDTGPGIPQALQAKVFDRFYKINSSTTNSHQGSGLGLHIVNKYIELLKGSINLTSELAKGTCISFEIPVTITTPNAIKHFHSVSYSKNFNPQPETWDEKKSSEKDLPLILLVEDNPIALKVIELETEALKYRHLLASTAEEAFTLYKEQHDKINLIITDVGLPGISGTELTHHIRLWEEKNNRQKIPIVGLTAHANQTARNECLMAGMNEVYTKPVTRLMLQQIHHNFLQQTSFSSSKKQNDLKNNFSYIESAPLFDQVKAQEILGNSEATHHVLKQIVSHEIKTDVTEIKKAYSEKNWYQIKRITHKLNSSAMYCGLTKMQLACFSFDQSKDWGDETLLEPIYENMLNVIEETQAHIQQFLEKPLYNQ